MTHQEVQPDTIERFVRHQLSPEERRAFEEHYFECEHCFEQAQVMARFVAGVRHAARTGMLNESVPEPWWASFFKPAAIVAMATTALLAVGVSWWLWKQISAPHQELAVRQMPTVTPQPTTPIEGASPAAPGESPRPDLLAHNRPTPIPESVPGKAPIVYLDSERGNNTPNQLTIPANANDAILKIDIDPGNSFSGFQFQVFDSSGKLAATVNAGRTTVRGVVSASLPTRLFQSGKHVVRCYGVRNGQQELVGEYKLQILKP